MQEQSSNHTDNPFSVSDLPPCCGTGCAVCVLDMVDDYAPSCLSPRNEKAPAAQQPEPPDALPACCNSGCLICVQDYPELFVNGRPDDNTALALLEAMEAAEHTLHLHSTAD